MWSDASLEFIASWRARAGPGALYAACYERPGRVPKRSEKKGEKNGRGQPPLPGVRELAPSTTTARVLPTQLKPGDRLTDSTGEWEVVGRPYTTAGGKNAHVRVRRVNQPEVADVRMWGAHERISVKRATAEEGK